jgi:hypothetical protein
MMRMRKASHDRNTASVCRLDRFDVDGDLSGVQLRQCDACSQLI